MTSPLPTPSLMARMENYNIDRDFRVASESSLRRSPMQCLAAEARPACAPLTGVSRAPAPWPPNCLGVRAPVVSEVATLPRVLIVDDEENQRRTLSIGLKLDGFDVSVTGSASEALRRLAAPPPIDLTMIDLMMPGLNGLELARQIRRMYPTVRVVLSSAYHLSARQVERADCGAVGFVPKPYRLEELCSFLRSKAKPTSSAPPI